MEARLKITIGTSHLEIEGSQDFVEKTYADFKSLLTIHAPEPKRRPVEAHKSASGASDKSRPASSSKAPKGDKKKKGFTRVDVNLRPSGKVSLKDFVAQYETPTKDELYLLCVNYLRDQLGVESVTVDHIYTCLDELNQRVPTHLRQVLTNTKNDKGWLDTSDFDNITMSTKGQNHLKFDLTKAE